MFSHEIIFSHVNVLKEVDRFHIREIKKNHNIIISYKRTTKTMYYLETCKYNLFQKIFDCRTLYDLFMSFGREQCNEHRI